VEDQPVRKDDPASIYRFILDRELGNQGFFAWGFLDRETLEETITASKADQAALSRYGIEHTESVAVVALRYGEGAFAPPLWASEKTRESGSVTVQIARFARANWYGEILARLKVAVTGLIGSTSAMGLSIPPSKTWKRLSNSALPERALALAAGLGALGKNGLLIAKPRGGGEASSAVLLGLLLCPVSLGVAEKAVPLSAPCGPCRRCLDACPTKALSGEGRDFSRELCLQNWTARDLNPPPVVERSLGTILYGCDSCLKACPYFTIDPLARTELGKLGPELPADFFSGRNGPGD